MNAKEQDLIAKADKLCRTGKPEQAVSILHDFANRNPRASNAIGLLSDISMQIAEQLLSSGNTPEAIIYLLIVAEKQPGNARAHFLAGAALASTGDHKKAAVHTDKALNLDPNNTDALFNRAQLFMHAGEEDNAIESYRKLLSINNAHAHAHGNLAILLHRQSLNDEARIHYEQAITLRPDVEAFRYGLAGIDGKAIPEVYVRKLFDEGADRFDMLLVDELEYRTPEHIRNLLEVNLERQDYSILDLGCGTGLSGKAVKDYADRLVGVDLSGGMLEKARQKAIYSELHQVEILKFMQETDESFDIIIASDVFNYVGDLSDIFRQCRQLLTNKGLFIFSAESSDSKSGFHMDVQNLRYTHSGTYVQSVIETSGFSLKEKKRVVLRKNYGKPVMGDIYLVTGSATE